MLAHLGSGARLATRNVLRAHLTSPATSLNLSTRRTFVTETVNTLSEGFLDLALAIPYPESIPVYSGTIILVTVVSRLILTVPFSVWAKKRQWRAEDLVLPQLQMEKPQILQQALKDMQRDGFRGDKDQARVEHSKRAMQLLKTRQKELFRQYGCSPTLTMSIPPITQLPIFVLTSLTISRTCQFPTVLDTESFLTLTSLAHADPTLTLPIVLGIVTLANVETSRWFISPQALEREKKVEEWRAKRRAKGETIIEPKKILQTSLRTLAVGRILIAALVPGAVQLYWVTSAVFGLAQTWVLDSIDAFRRRRATQSPSMNVSAPVPQPESTIIFKRMDPAPDQPKRQS